MFSFGKGVSGLHICIENHKNGSMYNSMYQALKTALSQVNNLENVEWYNNQYEGAMRDEPMVMVEFDPLEIEPVARMAGQTDIGIHLHVVTKAYTDLQENISDSTVEGHHALAEEVLETIEGYYLPFDGGTTRPLELVGWTPQYKYNGWLVTVINLTTIG